VLPSSRTYALILALVRIATGAIWLIHAVPKFLHPERFMPPTGIFATYLQNGIAKTAGPYHDFLVNVVSPNAVGFADLVRFGELCVGVSLVLGLLTRFGALVGILLPINYVAARGAMGSLSAWSSLDGTLALLTAISFVLPTGRFAGVDGLVARRPPRRPKVIAEVVPERPLEGPTAPP
jgi:thiosulfate dehydrogenase (quinone) large subunit